MTEITLPLQKVPASHKSPKNLIIFAKPKVGKTELAAALDDCLILDLEEGSAYVDAMKIEAKTIQDIANIGKQIREAGYPYKYVAVDTISALERICKPYAETLYSRTNMGKNWFKKDANGKLAKSSGKAVYGNIENMPKGAGYQWIYKAFFKALDMINKMAPRVILIGHVKDTQLEKEGGMVDSLELDLTGKLKRTTASLSDAIGYIYRKDKTKNYISFIPTEGIACGTRCDHLRNQEFLISELVTEENGTTKLDTHWDKIFID